MADLPQLTRCAVYLLDRLALPSVLCWSCGCSRLESAQASQDTLFRRKAARCHAREKSVLCLRSVKASGSQRSKTYLYSSIKTITGPFRLVQRTRSARGAQACDLHLGQSRHARRASFMSLQCIGDSRSLKENRIAVVSRDRGVVTV